MHIHTFHESIFIFAHVVQYAGLLVPPQRTLNYMATKLETKLNCDCRIVIKVIAV